MKAFWSVVLIFMLAHSAWAALGNDDETIDALYGNIVKRHLRDDGSVSVIYHKDKYFYQVLYEDLRSVREEYSHVDGTDLSAKEVAKLLKANAGRTTWHEVGSGHEKKWERSDHRAEASFIDQDGVRALQVRILTPHTSHN
jgi:hypothetical protein